VKDYHVQDVTALYGAEQPMAVHGAAVGHENTVSVRPASTLAVLDMVPTLRSRPRQGPVAAGRAGEGTGPRGPPEQHKNNATEPEGLANPPSCSQSGTCSSRHESHYKTLLQLPGAQSQTTPSRSATS